MNRFQVIITIALLIAFGKNHVLASEPQYTKRDSLIFETYIKSFENKKHLDIPTLTIETAKYFLGKPYTAHTLEVNEEEKLVINLREFDCTTFVENCMALARTLKAENATFATYANWLQKIRYKNGEIADYSSRLHYISDWAYEHRNSLQDVGKDAGGKAMKKEINFMSKNSHLYKHLKNKPTTQNKIKQVEDSLNKRELAYVIPKKDIYNSAKYLKDGDIVVFATSVAGLDYTHIGFIYNENNILKFIHASSTAKKTIIETKSLRDYCFQSKSCIGITVLRQKN